LDLALVDVEVVDKDGRRVPTALNTISFSTTGPVEWRGGIAQGDSLGRKPAPRPPASRRRRAPTR
jgi:beta-galactosidase